MALLDGKRLLITGVLTTDSLAYTTARRAIEEGADVALSGFGRGLSLTRRSARRLGDVGEVLDMDVTVPAQLDDAREALARRFGRLDGVLHAIGYAPPDCLGHGMLRASAEDVGIALQVSTYSLAGLTRAMLPLLDVAGADGGASVVGLDFDGTRAWPVYDWMGVAKAGLESLTRYLAKELGPRGIRVNLVASGPVRTVAAKSIPGFGAFEEAWGERAPLGWDVHDAAPAANGAVALLSDLLSSTTGHVLHVDGGVHALGM
ncbi:MAG TPA: enoyl-ACP reductase FabI [Acidimicrobiales bacterium]|nr:enoyl-ACP reductase FabI [Acidimicrobiales bacterium]